MSDFKKLPSDLTPEMVDAGIRKFKGMCGGYASLGEKLTAAFKAMADAAPTHIDDALAQSVSDRWTVFPNGVVLDIEA